MKLRLTLILLFWIVSIGNAWGEAQSSIGQVFSIAGTGQVMAIDQANQHRSLQRKSEIYLYDKIVTDKDSKAQLRLHDDSEIVVQPASEFYVSEFKYNPGSPHDNKYVGNIVKGMLINISGIGDTKNYRLNSPLATIAFRGTGLATKLIAKNGVLINQDVYVFAGYVNVSNKCENVVNELIKISCVPRQVNIGVGQQTNSAIIDMRGRIQGVNSSGLLMKGGVGEELTKTIIKGTNGSVITCKCK